MSHVRFTPKEQEYLHSQRIARVATVSRDDAHPDIAAVGYQFDGERIYLSGYNLQETQKYRNVVDSELAMIAVLIDDFDSVDPWQPRGVKIYGRAAIILHDGQEMIGVTPLQKWSWGIERPVFSHSS